MLHVNHDLHTHTLYSDGAHPIPLHVLEGRAFELDAIAITDHYMPGSKIEKSDDGVRPLPGRDRAAARRARSDVIVLKGAEATALDATGRISLDAQHAARLEWVLCDLGGFSEGTLRHPPADKQKYVENVVRTYLGLCDVPYLERHRPPLQHRQHPAGGPARGLSRAAAAGAGREDGRRRRRSST